MEMKVYLHAVEFIQTAFCIAPEVLDSIDVNSISFGELTLSMIYTVVPIEPHIY